MTVHEPLATVVWFTHFWCESSLVDSAEALMPKKHKRLLQRIENAEAKKKEQTKRPAPGNSGCTSGFVSALESGQSINKKLLARNVSFYKSTGF